MWNKINHGGEPTKNVDWVMYEISYALEGEEKDQGGPGIIREFSTEKMPTVLCVVHIDLYVSKSCVDIGEPVTIAKDVPELLVSDTINLLGTTKFMSFSDRLIEFTPYSSDKVNCQITVPQGGLSCY